MKSSKIQHRCQSSKIYECYRALGLITDDVPMVYSPMGKENFITVSIGKSFQVFNCEKLSIASISPQLPKKIRAIDSKMEITVTGCGMDLIVWNKIHQKGVLTRHNAPIQDVLIIGNALISIDEAHHMIVWNLKDMKAIHEHTFPTTFKPLFLMHPNAYLNKILVASEQGSIELWNIRTMKCIYAFKGWKSTPTCIVQSPVVDVVGIGLNNGLMLIQNLKYDETLMTFEQHEGQITSASFRTDTNAIPMVATGTALGSIALWNLKEQRLHTTIPDAHDGRIVSLIFLPNEPLLISSGVDNSIKMWIFDQTDGSARLLKSREGHKAPPKSIRYYGNNTLSTMADGADGTSCQLLSAGQDRSLRVFHTAREQQSREMSQGHLLKRAKKLNVKIENLKLSPILQFDAIETREKDWCNVSTCHENDINAYVWSFERRAIGKHILRQGEPIPWGTSEKKRTLLTEQEKLASGNAVSVCISICGNFGLVGTTSGAIFKYNLQSGAKRGSYPTAATKKPKLIRSLTLPGINSTITQDLTASHAHHGSISGLKIDALNQHLISCSLDGTLKFWNFITHELLQTIEIGSPISQMEIHRDSNMLLISCDDQIIRIYDIITRKLIRRFEGHTHLIVDMTFSKDARWIVSASLDNTIRVWDIPSGKCIEWIRFRKAVTSLTMSPTGEFLATTHVGKVGIYLWSDKSFFSNVYLDQEPTKPIEMDLPLPIAEEEKNLISNEKELNSINETTSTALDQTILQSNIEDSTPLNPDIITLSTAPPAYWQTLFNLELIKQRNKPIEPPKAPEQAPFFLPTVRKNEVEPTFATVSSTTNPSSEDVSTTTKLEGWDSDNENEEDESWAKPTIEEEKEDSIGENTIQSTSSRIVQTSGMTSARCKLACLLLQVSNEEAFISHRFHHVSQYLQNLSASAVDIELSNLSMGAFDEEGNQFLSLFMDYLIEELKSRRQFQVIQAYLNRFLKLYADILAQNSDMLIKLNQLYCVHQETWEHLQSLMHNNLCLVQYFSKIQV